LLTALTLADFTAALASDAPAPGGGSASAAAGAAGAALLAMVVKLTLGKEKYKDAWEELEPLGETLETIRKRLLELVDEDTKAFDAIVAARRLPKTTDEEKAARQHAIDAATVVATTVPMQTAFYAEQALKSAGTILEKGNPNAGSDALVAGHLLAAAVAGALANVRINLPGVADPELARGFREDAGDLAKRSDERLLKLRAAAQARGL
jgi:glutamate formiminotransferase/formiminotetrahydrofolate cyclodeaminase